MKKKSHGIGVISRDEAYSKDAVLERLGIAQTFWDKMLDDGMPYTVVGQTRWVTGGALFDYIDRHAQRKSAHCYHVAS